MKLIGVQMDIELGALEHNTTRIIERLNQAADRGAELVIFPECALSGYCHPNRAAALTASEPIAGPQQQRIIAACRERNVFCIVGLLERTDAELFNTCVLLGPNGVVGSYRKVHLPYVGADCFTDYGDRPFAIDTIPSRSAQSVNVGMNICYDAAFPEAARTLALLGADLIALPTNWPPGAECMSPAVICTRALENKIYYAAINRIGTEAGVPFIGRSCICGPDGTILDSAGPDEEKLLEAEIDIALTREKRIIRRADEHEIDRFADRRPEFYQQLLAPHELITPRERHAN